MINFPNSSNQFKLHQRPAASASAGSGQGGGGGYRPLRRGSAAPSKTQNKSNTVQATLFTQGSTPGLGEIIKLISNTVGMMVDSVLGINTASTLFDSNGRFVGDENYKPVDSFLPNKVGMGEVLKPKAPTSPFAASSQTIVLKDTNGSQRPLYPTGNLEA